MSTASLTPVPTASTLPSLGPRRLHFSPFTDAQMQLSAAWITCSWPREAEVMTGGGSTSRILCTRPRLAAACRVWGAITLKGSSAGALLVPAGSACCDRHGYIGRAALHGCRASCVTARAVDLDVCCRRWQLGRPAPWADWWSDDSAATPQQDWWPKHARDGFPALIAKHNTWDVHCRPAVVISSSMPKSLE